MFDEQPDGDPHGQCAAEIARLKRELAKMASLAQGILTALNVGDIRSGSLIHLDLRKKMIAYRDGEGET
jgi:hypothetical protein